MTDSRWWREPVGSEAAVILFCLPYAGAGAGMYRGWPAALGPRIGVQPVQLPGRETRISEDPSPDPAAIAKAVACRADRPFAIFGHSLGARLGFEVARELRRTGGPMPLCLFVSGARPPDLPLEARYNELPDNEFLAAVAGLEGMPPEVAEMPELRELILPILRADFAFLENYTLTDEAPLPIPIAGFAGTADPIASPELMSGWSRHTSAGHSQIVLPGGHFFLDAALPAIAARIRGGMLSDSRIKDVALATSLMPNSNNTMRRGAVASHRIPLGDTGWEVWREALLRTAGFPADGLAGFCSPGAAHAADELLAGRLSDAEFEAAFAEATAANSRFAYEVATDPLVREAITWQNPGALHALDGLAKGGPVAPRNYKRRHREELIARYWQRYCAKNETVGFFGPICWITLGEQTTVHSGPALTRERAVFLEYWAVRVLAETLERDQRLRVWLPARLRPHLVLDGRTVRHPSRPPIQLSAPQAHAVSMCDGTRSAREVVAALGLRQEGDGYLLLNQLVDSGVLIWGFDLPMRYTAEEELRRRLAALGEPAREALAKLDSLTEARVAVQRAAGDPGALAKALAELDERFVELTGEAARRRSGQAYAGRTLCHEETVRDLDVVLGPQVLDELAGPLEVMLGASRWLTSAIADAYTSALRELHRELGGGTVPLGQLWFLAQGLFFGGGERPCDAVAQAFTRRWERLLAGDTAAFPAQRPGWSLGRIHSPDLHLCASSAEALARGEFTAVLGEMHAAWPTFDTAVFLAGHPDPQRLRDALRADLGPGRVVPLYPVTWPRTTGRVTRGLDNETDWQLCFDDAPGATRALPIDALSVSEVDGTLTAATADGKRWPLLEVLSELLSLQAVDAFKLAASAPHTPRLTLGKLVVARETWHTTALDTGLGAVTGEAKRYLAVRRWRAELGLPERVFVKIASETKPFYVDLTSPVYASILCSAIRATEPATRIVVTEMLPTPDQAWVPDAAGRLYFSELRLQIVDPESPR